jgi:hypothetical protein
MRHARGGMFGIGGVSARSFVVGAGALVALAGSAMAAPGTDFSWIGAVDNTWSTAGNWTSNATAPDPNNPSNTGNANTSINFKTLANGAAAANRDTTIDLPGSVIPGGKKLAQNAAISNLYRIKFLSLNAGADGDYSVAASNGNLALHLVGAAGDDRIIENNASGSTLTMNLPIAIEDRLTVRGVAAAGLAGDLVFKQQISDGTIAGGAARPGNIVVRYDRKGLASFGAANTFTGGVELQLGNLGIDNDQALGTGQFTITSGTVVAQTVDRLIKNKVFVSGDFTLGDGKTLRLGGETTFAGDRILTIAKGFNKITIANGGGKLLSVPFGGKAPVLSIVGNDAPAIKAGKVARGDEGSVFEIEGATKGPGAKPAADGSLFDGTINVTSATFVLNGSLGGGTRNNAVVRLTGLTIGDGVNPAAIKGGGVRGNVNASKADVTTFFSGGPNGKATIKKGSAANIGNSPGVLGFDGGNFEMEGGSAISFFIDGLAPGEGPGFHSQLTITGATMILFNDAGLRPTLAPFVDGPNFLAQATIGDPLNTFSGSVVGIVDQVDSSGQLSLLSTGSLFQAQDGSLLTQGAIFTAADGFQWQISYTASLDGNGVLASAGDFFSANGNDVALRLVGVPTPGAALVLGLGGLVAARRRRQK